MRPKTPKTLEDIRDAAAFIRQVTVEKTLDQYRTDRLLRQAVERNFEIVGEAVKRLSETDPEVVSLIDGYKQIIAFRNILIHGYDLIDDEQVWRVVQNDLPTLIDTVRKLRFEGD